MRRNLIPATKHQQLKLVVLGAAHLTWMRWQALSDMFPRTRALAPSLIACIMPSPRARGAFLLPLPSSSASLIFREWNSFKTFLTLDYNACLARSHSWMRFRDESILSSRLRIRERYPMSNEYLYSNCNCIENLWDSMEENFIWPFFFDIWNYIFNMI